MKNINVNYKELKIDCKCFYVDEDVLLNRVNKC